jgi:O-antigen/teichoic acid export membrane protein
MSKIKSNILANYFGSVWQMAMGLLFVPLYIKFLGIESYGIIGFFTSLQIALFLLDMGLSTTFTREIARLAPTRTLDNSIRNSLMTFSRVYWIIAIFAGTLFIALSPIFSGHWLKAEHTPISVIRDATILMGLSIIVRWPGTIYTGGINALQKQVINNVIIIILSTIRGGGVVLLLWLVSPTLHAFFLWQIGCNLAQTIISAIVFKIEIRNVPGKGKFEWSILKQTWRFSAGMLGISILSTLLTQTDKILISKLVPLEQFGYYTLAVTTAGVLFVLIGPINNALLPRFTELVSLGDKTNLSSLFHAGCQSVSFVLLPFWAVFTFFPCEALFVWTHNQDLSHTVGPLLSLVAIGNMLNSMTNMLYNVQLAYGYTKLAIVFNSVSLALLVPLIFIFVHLFGIKGGALVWIILNIGYISIAAYLVLNKFLPSEKWKWYFNDILRFAIPCIFPVMVIKYFNQFLHENRLVDIGILSSTMIACIAVMLAVMPRSQRVGIFYFMRRIVTLKI